MSIWKGATVLLTGATGSFGRAFLRHALDELGVGTVRCYSRDELKQSEVWAGLSPQDQQRVRMLLGDVRDGARLGMACRGVRLVVHAAALKRVDAIAYDPEESVKTNIGGAINLVHAALAQGVQRVVAISTDKGCGPANLYGATKMVMEHLLSYAGAYAGGRDTRFACVRYGNVVGSRGSVVPLWLDQARRGDQLTLTDPRMTRFWITLPRAVRLVAWAGEHAGAGEVVVPDLPRSLVADMAEACRGAQESKSPPVYSLVGERPGGEKLHECLLSEHEGRIAQGAAPLPGGGGRVDGAARGRAHGGGVRPPAQQHAPPAGRGGLPGPAG